MLRHHRGPLSADLRRFYHCNLTDVLAGEVASLEDVAAWVAHLPTDAAVFRDAEPGRMAHTHDVELLRRIEFWLQGIRGVRHPEAYEFPWEDDDRPGFRGDAMTTDEADEFLGWGLHAV